jgi:hypothetical protein
MAAFVDWLVMRTLTRTAIFMPKPPPVILLYQVVGVVGQVVATLTGLLVMIALGWLAWNVFRDTASYFMPAACLGAAILNLLFLYILPTGWLAVGYHALLAGLILGFGLPTLRSSLRSRSQKAAALLLTLALAARELYQIIPAAYQAVKLPGPPAFNQAVFLSAELFAVLSLLAVWWAYGRTITWQAVLLASVPALAFAAFHLLNPAMLGIIAIWSTGFTLYLPWPVYALGLWAASLVVLTAAKQGSLAGWSVILLLAGGLTPQFSIQAFLGIIALWLLGCELDCREVVPEAASATTFAGQTASVGQE